MKRVPASSKLPCHRVINKSGEPAPSHVFGSKERQRGLLLSEGVTLLDGNLIDMKWHIWPDEEKPE